MTKPIKIELEDYEISCEMAQKRFPKEYEYFHKNTKKVLKGEAKELYDYKTRYFAYKGGLYIAGVKDGKAVLIQSLLSGATWKF